MVELLNNFPDHVAAYKASGFIDEQEYEQKILRRVDELSDRYDMLNFIVLLEHDPVNHNYYAFISHLKMSFSHFSMWNRMAVVTDEPAIRVAYEALTSLVHGEIRSYSLADYEDAKDWVCAPLLIDKQTHYN